MPKIASGEKIQLIAEGEITGEDSLYSERTGKRKFGTSTYKVYGALAGLQEEEEAVKPYLLVWLHGMDNGIELGHLTTIQKRLRHRVIFVVPMCPQTHKGTQFNWGCAFRARDDKKQLGFVHGKLHEGYLMALTSKISDLAYEFDAERVLVMGYSMGGFGAFQLGGFAPDAFDVVMSVAGYGLGTLEPEDAMYGAPQPASSEIFEEFLTGIASELSRVPIVLAVHAQKDSMSSFRDVKAIIKSCKETQAKRGVLHTAELLEVEDRWADSDRNRKKRRISGHHYFNFSLLDESSEDFLWSKLRKYLSQAPLRLELRPLHIARVGEEPRVGFKCPRCNGPRYMGPDEFSTKAKNLHYRYK
ncbi:Ribosomal large subunit pseudouridine synthase C [Durusdinium trenchii]|uniref:Ribosomal large subunit pseudouridine synthase C n=1 Tax=Durusdinium trenchii TaxID=1381693 RepID=A0ABP0K8Q7_9DINO